MIAEADVDAAVAFLRSSASKAAEARANTLYLAEWLKTVRAQVKLKQAGLSNAAAEDVALASAEFGEALNSYRQAAEADFTFRFKREAASAVIEAWRTEQASLRAEGKAYG